jgi:hypothetical protein
MRFGRSFFYGQNAVSGSNTMECSITSFIELRATASMRLDHPKPGLESLGTVFQESILVKGAGYAPPT